MNKFIKNKIISAFLATVFMLTLSLTVNAEDMQLQKAKEEITRLELENESLKEELKIYERMISEHKEKLAAYDNMGMDMNKEE
jgi:predicted RNase H-like nuclease (RuvC/YqgF family)